MVARWSFSTLTTGATVATIQLPSPHPGQQAVRRQARRINVLSAGRRWRKTTLMVSIGVEAAVHQKAVLWGAPTFDQVRIGWNETRHAAGGVADFKTSTMTATFPGGGIIVYRSLDDPDNARGHTADGVIIDEAGDVAERAWYEVMRPMLIDTDGWAWIVGTPKGRNWFWREYAAALDRDDAARWQIPTLGCRIEDGRLVRDPHPLENPDIPWREIEHIFSTTPIDVFRQEIMAEFLENQGAVFRNISANLYAGGETPEDHAEHRIVMGVDWGKQRDFTALSVVCADCRKELALDRFNQIDYTVQRGRLRALAERWHVGHIVAESNAMGTPIIEQLVRDSLPVQGFETTASTKPPLIESLALAFEREEVEWLEHPAATMELEAYERKVSGTTGRSQYSAPEGLHDDTVMARALANHAINQYAWWID
ncbi:MAG: hypothetical protein GF364_22695 [Candidatus Lokiarchaeota archaeon]|nr:hypothetical protein [Candidatus Lokiarchaeota archaeon]